MDEHGLKIVCRMKRPLCLNGEVGRGYLGAFYHFLRSISEGLRRDCLLKLIVSALRTLVLSMGVSQCLSPIY